VKFLLVIILSNPCAGAAYVPIGEIEGLAACEEIGARMAAISAAASGGMTVRHQCLPPGDPA